MPSGKSETSGSHSPAPVATSPVTQTPPAKRSSGFYMKKMRAGLAEAGYVKHEAWVLPEHRETLKRIEKQLRQPFQAGPLKLEEYMSTAEHWTLDRLYGALQATDEVTRGETILTLTQGSEQTIRLEMTEYGNLPIHIAVVGDQIIVDTVLVDADSITDVVKFNEAVLRSRELFPLSSIGIESMPNGQTVYNMFGALSATSTLSNVTTEISTLVDNVQRAAEAFDPFFK